ncbi:small lysine-rich protein 1 [Boleophthalmus pectinirostris]|uniref:small lysine-rich protein 1 n=1 Tax=Boleophthalmus pectinirostris TaxID=150288 RepID=UPI00242FFE12|nr:small lysine-rich protein 1 [Boleophthalmus pectinirostris]
MQTTRKTRSHSSRPAKKPGPSQTHNKTPKKKSASAKTPKPEVDLLSAAAMENLFYISHNAAHCLEFRGFGWAKKSKSRKKTKGKKRKNKK